MITWRLRTSLGFKDNHRRIARVYRDLGLLSKLVKEDFLSFSQHHGRVNCSRRPTKIVSGSIYLVNARVSINTGYFEEGSFAVDAKKNLYTLNGQCSSVRIVYNWKLFAPDYGCKTTFTK